MSPGTGFASLSSLRAEDAEKFARAVAAIRREPGNALYHCTLGEMLAGRGRTGDAVLCYREALRLDPECLAALVNLGNALQIQGRYAEACAVYGRAIERHPACPEAYNNLGNALRALGNSEEALACYREALRLRPESADTAVNVAGALLGLKRPAEAEPWARRALEWRPESAAAHSALSVSLKGQRRFAEAEDAAREALACGHGAAHLHSNLGTVLLCRKQFEQAEAALARALELRPDDAETRTALATALAGQDRLEEAAAQCESVIRSHRDFGGAWTELGLIREGQGRYREALAALDEAVRIEPSHARARFARSLALLRAGRLAEGFAEYEWRWEVLARKPRSFGRPGWDGGPLEGKTILLSAEQGLGDAIQFVRYVPLVAGRGGRVIVEVKPCLAPLLAGVEGVTEVITPEMPLPPIDEHAPLLSLPRILGTTAETIPVKSPYLHADARVAARLRAQLGPVRGLRIGIAWSGNREHPGDRQRSAGLDRLGRLGGAEGVEWYSLHIGEKAREETRRAGWVRTILSEDGGLEELAGLMCCLDLVVSVDSMPAHLAGALGRPVWTLLGAGADWRWQAEREDSPWYPTMRLFRQSRRGDWEEVAERVCRALQEAIQVPAVLDDKGY